MSTGLKTLLTAGCIKSVPSLLELCLWETVLSADGYDAGDVNMKCLLKVLIGIGSVCNIAL